MAATLFLGVPLGSAGDGQSELYPGAATFIYPPHRPYRSDVIIRPLSECAYTTNDSYEQVLSFYDKKGTRYRSPDERVEELRNGQALKHVVVILDGAPDLSMSQHWVILERPFPVGAVIVNGQVQPAEIRDVTRISLMTRTASESASVACAK